MERIHSSTLRSVDQLAIVGVAVQSIRPDQQHIGILHRSSERNAIQMLHLAWHMRLRNDPPRGPLVWIDPSIHPLRAKQLAAFCRLVWSRNPRGLPYALSQPNDCFDVTGEFRPNGNCLGLTCATFVMAVFRATGLTLIDVQQWPFRDEDVAWQEQILAALREQGASEDHVKLVSTQVRAARFRPEEVGGASAHSPWPASFDDAVRLANHILRLLRVPE